VFQRIPLTDSLSFWQIHSGFFKAIHVMMSAVYIWKRGLCDEHQQVAYLTQVRTRLCWKVVLKCKCCIGTTGVVY